MADLTVIAASCTGRSLAVLLLCLRRQAEPRAVLLVLAGRSRAAIFVLSRLALAAVAHQANPDAGGVRRREPRSGEVFAACHRLGAAGFIRSRQFLTVGPKR